MNENRLSCETLLSQCERIKRMVKIVQDTKEYKKDYYAKYHHWKLHDVVPLSEIEEFEEKTGIELPVEYVYFLTQIGRGGASPGTELDDFDMEWAEDEKLSQVSEQLSCVLSDKEWEELYGGHGDEPGTICLCAMDLTYQAYLIVSGPMKGKIVYMDWDGDCAPMWPKGLPDILTWYEQFFSEKLAGYEISPTWKFMWQQPGDEDDLIQAFHESGDIEWKKEILWSFYKFKKISDKTYDFLAGLRGSEFEKEAVDLIKYF